MEKNLEEERIQLKSQVRIMVVDDNRDIVYIIKRALEDNGVAIVDAFNDPQEALSNFKPDFYSLSIIDIRMPKMNGFELHREMMRIDDNAKTCFLSASETYNDELLKVSPSLVARCVMKKPISLAELVKHVRLEMQEMIR